MNQNKTGLVLGSFVAFLHLVWSILIALDWAYPLQNFIYKMHSMNNPYVIEPFDIVRSIELIVITFFVGYIAGNVFAFFWNKIYK